METSSMLTRRFTVATDDTALAVGSGTMHVLGTPCLIAWMEAVTCEAIAPSLPPGSTSVGTRIDVEHLAPSAVDAEVEVQVSLAYQDGRLHRFTVSARNVVDGKPVQVVASGEITRVVVDQEKFTSRLRA